MEVIRIMWKVFALIMKIDCGPLAQNNSISTIENTQKTIPTSNNSCEFCSDRKG